MKKLKTATLLIAASAALSSAPAYAKDDQKVYVPEKGKTSSPVGRPKQPSKSFVYVTIDSDIDELSFEFSEDIQTLYVVLTTQGTGEIQAGMVDHANPTMSATVSDGTVYTISCITDAGIEFETTIEP